MLAQKIYKLVLNIFTIKALFSVIVQVNAFNKAMNENLYNEVLNSSACEEQIKYIIFNDPFLRAQFMDASLRTPKRILKYNLRDFGSYYECLAINKEHLNTTVDGKYCVMKIHLSQAIFMPGLKPGFPWAEENWHNNTNKSNEGGKAIMKSILGNKKNKTRYDQHFELAICIPKVCTTQQALRILTKGVSTNFDISEAFCRLPNDKLWAAEEYVAISIFSVLGLLTLISTTYDVHNVILLKRDPKDINKLFTTFSVYSNTKKFLTFKNNPNTLHCLDGIRSISMFWVFVGHIFSTQFFYRPANPVDFSKFLTFFSSLWIIASPIAVDTFLMIGGILVIYSSASKLSGRALLKNLHIFYLTRLLRLFPVLATAVLLQASLLNHVTDGPYWDIMEKTVNDCRENWWLTLLYIQNIVNLTNMCLCNSWYLALDMQLYITSPLVLFFVLGRQKRTAWMALIGAFLLFLITSTIYNFIMEFRSGLINFMIPDQEIYYTQYYYMNTMTRAASFYVGMIFGYILHLCRGKQVEIPMVQVLLIWILALGTTTAVVISHYFPFQPDWDNQTVESVLNSFTRPAWAAGVAWVVFACAHGYAGPINWFLSQHIFKILSRLSYAIYIFHYPITYITNATNLAPMYFSVELSIKKFIVDLNITLIVAFLVTILIDLPFSRLTGMLMGQKDTNKRKIQRTVNVKITDA